MTPKEKSKELVCKLYHNHNVIIDTKIYTELTIDYWQEVKQEIIKS